MSANEIVRQLCKLSLDDDREADILAVEMITSETWKRCFDPSSPNPCNWDDVVIEVLGRCLKILQRRNMAFAKVSKVG